jgi:hypothetical protein
MTEERWSLGGFADQYSWPQCRYCGRAQSHDCPRVECTLCGSPQCFGNGSGNGHCAVCHHGLLPGWSGVSRIMREGCAYKGCDHGAIATARKRAVCVDHAQRIKVSGGLTLAEYVERQLAHRDSGKGWQHWRLVA